MKVNINIPVCVSCQSSIGDVYPVFDLIRTKRMEEIAARDGVEPESISDIDMRDILDLLNINSMCCRTAMLGFVREIPLH